MFGTNRVLKPTFIVNAGEAAVAQTEIDGSEVMVNSIFGTIQGEGPHAGEPAVFVRLTGCNLRCHFCDTEFEKGQRMPIGNIIFDIKKEMQTCDTGLIVLTGGEPMRQQIIPLIHRMYIQEGWFTQIETAGTLWPVPAYVGHENTMTSMRELIKRGIAELVCSPKTPRIHPEVEALCEHFKYIIRHGELSIHDGLPEMSTQDPRRRSPVYRPDLEDNVTSTIWVQPMAEYRAAEFGEAASIKHPDTRRTNLNMSECVRIAKQYGYRISLQQHKILGVE